MSYRQIRINKTEELQEVLKELQHYYKSMSEADLFKMFLIQAYADLKQCDSGCEPETIADPECF